MEKKKLTKKEIKQNFNSPVALKYSLFIGKSKVHYYDEIPIYKHCEICLKSFRQGEPRFATNSIKYVPTGVKKWIARTDSHKICHNCLKGICLLLEKEHKSWFKKKSPKLVLESLE